VTQKTIRQRGKLFRRELSPGWRALLVNLPSFLLIGGTIGYPLLTGVNIAFRDVSIRSFITDVMPWVGLRNFVQILSDSLFIASLVQTLVFVAVSVTLEVVLGLAIALTVNMRRARLARLTKALLPWAVPPIANGLMWSFIFNSKYGPLNAVLYKLGFIDNSVQWISDPTLALGAVVVAYV
jgi:ABC-type sugar transport system permease subunit